MTESNSITETKTETKTPILLKTKEQVPHILGRRRRKHQPVMIETKEPVTHETKGPVEPEAMDTAVEEGRAAEEGQKDTPDTPQASEPDGFGVDKGQVHAGLSIGLRSILIMRLIVLPQAIRNIFPALGNQAISMLKDSSLVAVISALDLMRSGQLLALSTFKYMLIYTMVAVLYFALSFVTARGLNRAERALQIPD